MKFAVVVLLSLVSFAYSAPQPRKIFHEHFDDFMNIIVEEVGVELGALFEKYKESDEFVAALEYLRTNDFKQLVYEMESLPEFQAVVGFLENHSIDVLFFIDLFNEMLESVKIQRSARQEPSGKDFTAYLNDIINLFPKDKLAALYDEKIAEDEEFRSAMENFSSDEWDEVFTALWNSELFQKEVQTLLEHGIDVHVLLREIMAIFGQN